MSVKGTGVYRTRRGRFGKTILQEFWSDTSAVDRYHQGMFGYEGGWRDVRFQEAPSGYLVMKDIEGIEE